MKKIALMLGFPGLLAIVSVPTSPAHAQATRTFVSGVGNDADPCTRTLPCRTFGGALTQTAAGGEINCVDPGGYGSVTITKSITIDCGGTYGSVLHTSSNGIIINDSGTGSPNTIDVIIRNLSINGSGMPLGINGIYYISGRSVHVENVTIESAATAGINVSKNTFGTLTVRNVSFMFMPVGIKLATTAGNIVASISDCKFNGMTNNGVDAAATSYAGVANSVFSTVGGAAILASSATSTVYAKNNLITNSNHGISASVAGAKITASGNGMYGNTKAFNAAAGAIFLSANNNEVDINPGNPSTGFLTVK
jgi:hypothetical protein